MPKKTRILNVLFVKNLQLLEKVNVVVNRKEIV